VVPHAAIAPPKVSSSKTGAPKIGTAKKKVVLVVEPDAEIRARIVRAVKQAAGAEGDRISIHEAENGSAAWALVEVVKPDLVIAEVLLEGMSGLQLLRRLAERYPQDRPPIFFVTEMGNEVDRYWALKNGANAYVVKPFDDEFLEARAAEFFANGGESARDSGWPLDP
jgi:DNA-binding response OmpR family regulator